MWLTLLGLLPGLLGKVTDYFAARQNAQVQMYMAKTGADKEAAIAALQASTSVQTKWWFVAAIGPMFAIPCVAFMWKCIIWDNLLGLGTTDPLRGDVQWAFIIIVGSTFAMGAVDRIINKK